MCVLTIIGRIGNKRPTRFVIAGTTDANTIPVIPASPKGIFRTDAVGTLTTRKIRRAFASAKLVLVLLIFTNRKGCSFFMRVPPPRRRPKFSRFVRCHVATATPRHCPALAQNPQCDSAPSSPRSAGRESYKAWPIHPQPIRNPLAPPDSTRPTLSTLVPPAPPDPARSRLPTPATWQCPPTRPGNPPAGNSHRSQSRELRAESRRPLPAVPSRCPPAFSHS